MNNRLVKLLKTFALLKTLQKVQGIDLSKGAQGNWKKEGYQIVAEKGLYYKKPVIHIKAVHPDHGVVGETYLSDKNTHFHPEETSVDSEHQRKGLATGMYEFAEKKFGKPIGQPRVYDQSEEAQALWNQDNRPFGKSETLEKVDKPQRPGQISEDGRYISDFHPNGNLIWYYHPNEAFKTDSFIRSKKDSYINRLPKQHRQIVSDMFDHVMKDPNRHAVAAFDQPGKPGIRARHLKSLILGHPSIKLHSHGPNDISLKAIRHGLGSNFNEQHIIPFSNKQKLAMTEMQHYLKDSLLAKNWESSYLLHKSDDQPRVLYHYSTQPGLKEIDPKKMGTSGVRSGGQYKYFDPSKIADFPHTSFHYIADEPEDIVKLGAASKYTLHLNPDQRLYDLSKDHEGLANQAITENNGVWNTENVFRKVKDAGYHGIWVSNKDAHPTIRNTVQIFHPHPVSVEEGVK